MCTLDKAIGRLTAAAKEQGVENIVSFLDQLPEDLFARLENIDERVDFSVVDVSIRVNDV